MGSGRKPADQLAVEGASVRQRCYDFMRARDNRWWTLSELAHSAKVSLSAAQSYVHALQVGGIVIEHSDWSAERDRLSNRISIRVAFAECEYRLVRDFGVEAPRVTKGGQLREGLSTQDAMWKAIRVLRMFDWTDIAAAVGNDAAQVPAQTVKAYIKHLHGAGYLRKVIADRPGTPATWRLLNNRDTGPRAPMIQRTKVVFDPNEGRVVHRWTDAPDEPGAETAEVA